MESFLPAVASIVVTLTTIFLFLCLEDEMVGAVLCTIPLLVVFFFIRSLEGLVPGPVVQMLDFYVFIIIVMMVINFVKNLV